MRMPSFLLRLLFAWLSGAEACRAHGVYVFAFVDGDEVQVEAYFSARRKVRHGRIAVVDQETGTAVLDGVTDEQGLFRFRPPEEFLATGHGLTIRLDAGEGHRTRWNMTADDLRALSPRAAPPGGAALSLPGGPPSSAPPAAGEEGPGASPLPLPGSAAEWEALIGRVVDAKLAPVRRALARQGRRDPNLRDVVGGLGWIAGLLGLAAYLKTRRT